jgi:hypothetical protein
VAINFYCYKLQKRKVEKRRLKTESRARLARVIWEGVKEIELGE